MINANSPIHEGCLITGSLFSESMRVETVHPGGKDTWTVGLVGMQSERFRKVTLTSHDIEGLTIFDLSSGDLRLIEVKGLSAATGTILLTPNERRVAEDRRDCYWLYVVTNCGSEPILQEPIRDPARFEWREVTKVAHYWLEVNAMTRPMMVREDQSPYGEKDQQ